MSQRKRYIEQATIFEHIEKPNDYDSLKAWQRHNMRQKARLAYDREKDAGHNDKWCAYIAFETVKGSARFYAEQNRQVENNRRCGARTKRNAGKPCRMKPELGRKRCKYHGGMSTGPKSLEGKIKALSSLVQYQNRPDLLAARIENLRAEYSKSVKGRNDNSA